MNTQFEILDNNFNTITSQELQDINGGSWPGEGLVRAIFDVGVQTGRALAKWF